MCIKWEKISSTYFNVSNGVPQGGVLSPKMIAIYVDDFSLDLIMCKYTVDVILMKRATTGNSSDKSNYRPIALAVQGYLKFVAWK